MEATRVLAEAPNLLASSLDYDRTLATVAELAVRALADFCIIDMIEDGELKRVQVAHADRAKRSLTRELLRFPLDRQRPHMSLEALETQRSVLVPVVTPALLDSLAQSEEHRGIIGALNPRAYMAVPLLARKQLLGVILFVSSSRSFGEKDLELAETLVRLGALEVDNARLYREAQRALKARDRVLGIVAHDLRNPLNVISMIAELLREDTLPRERRIEHADMILRAARRMNRLIQDLLDVARIEAGRLSLRRERHDATRLAHEAIEMNSALAAARSITLACAHCDAHPTIDADRDRIIQLFDNLIGNAIKFTPEGGRIDVRVETLGEGAHITVSDTGPGIAEADLPQLFQPFWQAQRRSIEGAGLGLTIARGIVEAHGGRIWAESTPGTGSTFHFTIPASPAGAARERRRGPADRRAAVTEPRPVDS